MCSFYTTSERREVIRPGSRGSLRALHGSSKVLNALSCYLSLLFEHDTKRDMEGGGGG